MEPTSRIQNFIDYVAVEKDDDDIRVVFNGTSCGLNATTWASKFWLSTHTTMTRLLSYGYRVVDADIGEMILNFPLQFEQSDSH